MPFGHCSTAALHVSGGHRMGSIGILAYGSLIEEPGKEIEPLIRERRKGIKTPFSIEFARSSSTRDGAPTLVPVEDTPPDRSTAARFRVG